MTDPTLRRPLRRRVFLQVCGTTAAGVVIAGCGNDDDDAGAETATTQEQADVTLDFSRVAGVLNYAYALEQLEAAFYTQARETVAKPTESEYGRVIDALKGHEIAHREFFKEVLGDDAVGALEVNFSQIDFDDQENVLEVASRDAARRAASLGCTGARRDEPLTQEEVLAIVKPFLKS